MNSTNRDMIRGLTTRILSAMAPQEVELSSVLLDPLIDMTQSGEMVTIDRVEHAGGFGGADMLLISVVPVVMELLKRCEREPGNGQTPKVTPEWVREIARKTGSTGGMRMAGKIAEICNQWLASEASC